MVYCSKLRPACGKLYPARHARRKSLVCVIALTLSSGTPVVKADPTGGIGDTGRLKSEQNRSTPTPLPSQEDDRDFILPPIQEPHDKDTLGSGVQFYLRGVHVKGVTAFSDDVIAQICKEYIGRHVTTDDLHDLRDSITRLYIHAGYINSGAILPDQNIGGGEVTFQVIEGRLNDIRIQGLTRLNDSYVRDRLMHQASSPLNANRLNTGLLLLRDNPLIGTISARLDPGQELGTADLDVSVTEARPYDIQLALDNHRNPSVGANQATISMVHRNLTGGGDSASLDYSLSSGSDQYAVSYARPIASNDAMMRAYYQDSESQVIERAFRDVGIETRGDTAGLEVSFPTHRDLNRQSNFGGSVEHERTRTYFLGMPFSFTPGVVNGQAEVSRANLFHQVSYRTSNEAYAIRNTLIIGTDWFGATVHERAPDSRYTALHSQAQGVRVLGRRGRLIGRMDLFFTNDELLSSEKSAIGGAYSVRGYRDSVLVEERTLTGSLEYRGQINPGLSQTHQWEWAVFADAGVVDSTDTPTPTPSSIASAGVGLLYHYQEHVDASVYLAKPSRDIDQSDEELVDRGVHLEMVLRW